MATRKSTKKTTARGKGKPSKPNNPLVAAQAVLGKVLKDDGLFVETDENRLAQSLPHLPTGSIVIDNLIGGRVNQRGIMPCPGLPRSRLVILYGRESSGKTTLCLTACATTIANGGTVCFIDWEHSIDLAYAAAIGVPVQDRSKFALSQPETLEQGIKVIWTMARAGVDLFIVDSVSAGVPNAKLNQALTEKGDTGQPGTVARIWSDFLPQLKSVIARTGSCVVGISQLRKTISKTSFGPTTTTAGGEAWKYYSELRIMLTRVKTEKGKVYDPRLHRKKEAATGNVVKAKIDKCKVAASQGLEDEFFIKFGEGIDDVRSVVETAVAHGVAKKKGTWISYERADGTTLRAQGAAVFKEQLLAAKGAWVELYQATLQSMTQATPASVVEEEVEEELDMEEIDAILTGKVSVDGAPETEDG